MLSYPKRSDIKSTNYTVSRKMRNILLLVICALLLQSCNPKPVNNRETIEHMTTLPKDLLDYLSSSDAATIVMTEGEVRTAIFHSSEDLTLKSFSVEDPEDDSIKASFNGYSLLKAADGYDSEGILLWFSDLEQYGSWDCDHLAIITYPGVTWKDIQESPTWYINGQWYPENVKHRKISPQDRF